MPDTDSCSHPECNAMFRAKVWILEQAQDVTSPIGREIVTMAAEGKYSKQEALVNILQDTIMALIDVEAIKEVVESFRMLDELRKHAENN